MLRNLGVWGAALSMAATPVLAIEHVVMVYSDGFFPTTSYVQPGDTVRFVNLSEVEESVFSLNTVPTEDPDDAAGGQGVNHRMASPVSKTTCRSVPSSSSTS